MEVEKMREYALLALGVAVCLTAAVLMAFGEGVLGENHAGIATVIGIVGIGLLGTFAATSSKGVPKKQNHQAEVC
jgi:deoxyinosine 3'endonuclease (endonuclease V)